MLVSAKEMLDKAKAGHYAVGQFNINNLEWTKSILLTAQECNSPVILGVSERSEEHTSELQSRQYLVCRLLLEKKNVALTVGVFLLLFGAGLWAFTRMGHRFAMVERGVGLVKKKRRIAFSVFFFNDTATTEIYTLSLHDALPILY